MLEIDATEISDDTNLLDCGMDSIRLMSLIERWRAFGVRADFPALTGTYLVADWLTILGSGRSGGGSPSRQARSTGADDGRLA
ncbi:phosphopantetheine-binding protein [Rhodococcus sp. NPDC058481]